MKIIVRHEDGSDNGYLGTYFVSDYPEPPAVVIIGYNCEVVDIGEADLDTYIEENGLLRYEDQF